jgi:hypothetical protein
VSVQSVTCNDPLVKVTTLTVNGPVATCASTCPPGQQSYQGVCYAFTLRLYDSPVDVSNMS